MFVPTLQVDANLKEMEESKQEEIRIADLHLPNSEELQNGVRRFKIV